MKLGNTEIKILKTSELKSMKIEKPEIQRIIDSVKVQDIVLFS